MKKLALVLGSLLVVGTAASAKEVMPAPVVVPEKVVEVVEKPVIVYRDREVAPAWRPNGSVDVHLRNWTKIEHHDTNDKDWGGKDEWTELRTTSTINFTPNQTLTIHTRNKYGIDDENYEQADFNRLVLTHAYNFGNLGTSKVKASWYNQFRHGNAGEVGSVFSDELNEAIEELKEDLPQAPNVNVVEEFKKIAEIKLNSELKFNKWVETGVKFDFSEYFFQNDFIKTTALELAPFYRYQWNKGSEYANNLGLYANAEFELPLGFTFQAEFDDLFNYSRVNGYQYDLMFNDMGDFIGLSRTHKKLKGKTGTVELVLANAFEVYKDDRNSVKVGADFKYAIDWAYNKKSVGWTNADLAVGEAGTVRSNGKKEKLGAYEATIDPYVSYAFKATDFVKIYTRVGAEYKNRVTYRHGAKHWRWQPYARVGLTVTF